MADAGNEEDGGWGLELGLVLGGGGGGGCGGADVADVAGLAAALGVEDGGGGGEDLVCAGSLFEQGAVGFG